MSSVHAAVGLIGRAYQLSVLNRAEYLAHSGPLRYLETFAKNLDDGIERLDWKDFWSICSDQAPHGHDVGRDPRCASASRLQCISLHRVVFLLAIGRDQGVFFGRYDSLAPKIILIILCLSSLRAACQNFVALASDPTLTAAFGITETRRLQLVQRELVRALADVK